MMLGVINVTLMRVMPLAHGGKRVIGISITPFYLV